MILAADDAAIIYLSALVYGCFDNHYPVNLAYIADITTQKQRAKVYAVLVGFAVGLGFTIGAPLGGVLMERFGIPMPFYVSIASSALYIVFILLVPYSDVLGNEEKKRRLPVSWNSFLRAHHPFSGLSLIKRASTPYDWATNFLGGVAQQALQGVFLLYVEGVLGFTPAQAGEVFAFIGVSIAIFGPLLLARWQELALVSSGMLCSVIGYTFLSIAGVPGVKWMGFPGFLFIAVGGVWNSALTSVITLQYDKNSLGAVAGVFAQLKELAVLPAYPLALFFAYSLSSPTISKGAVWLLAALFLVLGVAVQVHVHKSSAMYLKRRVAAVTPEPSASDDVPAEKGLGKKEEESSSPVNNPLQNVDKI
jgi:MFS family permease